VCYLLRVLEFELGDLFFAADVLLLDLHQVLDLLLVVLVAQQLRVLKQVERVTG
jgi:hypothetical protein